MLVMHRFDEMNGVLASHMCQEEEKIFPVASTSMSQHEWDAFGRHGMATTPKDRILIQLAYALDSFTPRGRNRLDESGHPRSDPRPLSHGWPEAVRGGLQPHLRDGPDLPHLKPPLGRRAAHGHF